MAKYQGQYLVDGQRMDDFDLGSEFINFVSPDDDFFHISLRDNLTLGKDIATQEIEQALRVVCADDFVENLEEVFGTTGSAFLLANSSV